MQRMQVFWKQSKKHIPGPGAPTPNQSRPKLLGLLPPESRSRINTGFVAVVLMAHVPIAGNTHKRSNVAFIYYNRQACCCSLRSQQHFCGSVQELVQMKLWLADSLAVFTKRPAQLAVVPCIVSYQLNRHGNIIWLQKWTCIIQSAIIGQSHLSLVVGAR